jgi:uncharacterized protein (TIGR01777 family)
MRIFITGGTGLVGTRLVQRLHERKDEVLVLTRNPAAGRPRLGSACTIVPGDPTQPGDWMSAVEECDAVINLAGEGIFSHRWNDEVKAKIRDSRIQSTANVVEALARNARSATGRPKVLVNASAIGFYGPHGDEELTETDPPGADFLATVCVEWENTASKAEANGVRVALIRTGVVLDSRGGALAQMLTPFKWFVGGPVGSGLQWLSWIHYADLLGIYTLALDYDQVRGPLNATAPNPVTNREFSKALGRALHRPSFLRTPKFALRLMLGEVAGLVIQGQRVSSRKAVTLGYAFRFSDVDAALRDILEAETRVNAA